ncbi:MAG: peptide/nickel transport system substrate-binding protein [Thermomicrobiales bacterium]|jgi:peptide/nickel transport system substrate-binding protein|nr:peptide/nickel transport system substrate-binding protein [Thermomicrobiales bacterium]
MTLIDELKMLSNDYAARRISRRSLGRRAAALGLSAAWTAALAKGATAAPAPTWRTTDRLSQADKATTFIVAVEGDIDTFDPAFTVNSKTAQTIIQNTFDQLTQYQVVDRTAPDGTPYTTVDTEQIIGMLAESWTADGANLIFTLREGATYSNGDPIDSSAWLTGYQRVLETGGISQALLQMGGGVSGPDAVSAPDPKTFVIAMSQPNSLIPKNNVMHNTSALNPKELGAHTTESDPWAKDYFKQNLGTGNGPYKLDAYKPGDSITLVANSSYYGEQPSFTTVILKIVPEPVQRVQLLQKGDVDFATLLPIKEYESLKADPNLKTLSIPSRMLTLLELNGTIAPFDNKLVRQAVAFATPYQSIIDVVYKGQAAKASGIIPNGMPTSDPTTSPFVEDVEQAKALLEQAGFPEGNGLPEIKLSIRTGDEGWERIAFLEQAALKRIGIDLKIEPLAYASYNELQQGGKLQFSVSEFLAWVNDPFYQLFWTAVSTSPVNFPRFTSDRVDELVNQFTLAPDGPEREAASKEAQTIVNDASNYIALCQPNWTVFTRADVDGYVYYNDELPRYARFKRTT